MKAPCLYIILLFVMAGQLNAQQLGNNNYTVYNTSKGLSHNSVTDMAQDSAGYLWLTTFSGLNRFNGRQFVQYHSSNDSNSLASEFLHGLTWVGRNKLAVINAGLQIINTKTGERKNLFIPYHRQQYQFKFNMIVKVVSDKKDNIFVLTRSGFYHFDKNQQLVSRFDYYREEHVPTLHFVFGRELLQLDEKRFLIVAISGLYIYDTDKKKMRLMVAGDSELLKEYLDYTTHYRLFLPLQPGALFVVDTDSDSLTYVNIKENRKVVSKLPITPLKDVFLYRSKIIPVNDTLFYIIGQSTGFYKMRFYPETGKVVMDTTKYFPSHQCNTLFIDRDKHLWVATTNGLFRHDPDRAKVEISPVPEELEKQYPNIVMGEVFISGNNVYVGARQKSNLLIYDKNTFKLVRRIDMSPLQKSMNKSVNIYSLTEADSSTLLASTDGPLLFIKKDGRKIVPFYPSEWERSDWSNEMFKDSKGNIWISSLNVYKYNPVSKEVFTIPWQLQLTSMINMPEVIREDGDGNLWMAGHGISRYNTSSMKYDLLLDSFPFIKMPDKQVSTMVIDKKRNILWFNSNNNGLLSYDIGLGKFRHFTTNNGLPNNNISSLTIYNNKLWIAAYTGMACLDLTTFEIVTFGKEEGFPDMPIPTGGNFFYDSSMKKLYLGYPKMLVRFNPDELVGKKAAPNIFIEEVTLNNHKKLFLPDNEIETSWKDNQINISIGSINFDDGSTQRFAYRIFKNDSTSWTELGTQSHFTISSLPAGNHILQVKSYSVTNRWPAQVNQFRVTVTPPWWQKDWFYFLTGMAILALIFLLIQWRSGVARKKEMEKTQIEKLKADDYKNQFELQQISNYFSSSLSGKNSEDDVLWDVASNLIGRMNYEECIIYMWNEDKSKMVQKAAYGPKGDPWVINQNLFEVSPGQGIVGHVIESRQPLLVKDTRADHRYRVDDEFRLSEICVPIIHDGELLGIIDSEHKKANYFTERDIKILTTIATLLGNKLKQIESEKSLEEKQMELVGINEQLAEARLAALQAQMNPHFVFNALNSIKRMILDGDNEKASRYLSKFALMIRMTLEHSKELFVTLDENIKYIRAYLEMEQLRFDEAFHFQVLVDEDIDITETVLPSMMIQPLVENAIWHGLMQATTEKKIVISFCQDQSRIICVVEDNGIGIRKSESLKEKQRPLHKSVGLENLQKRIKIMNEKYDMDCVLSITDIYETDKTGSGTRVVLEFNLVNV